MKKDPKKGYKPDFVLDYHSSWAFVALDLMRPTRLLELAVLKHRPIWTCTL